LCPSLRSLRFSQCSLFGASRFYSLSAARVASARKGLNDCAPIRYDTDEITKYPFITIGSSEDVAKKLPSSVRFVKMHGIGNDYVYVDAITEELDPEVEKQLAIAVSDRHKGIGGDGLIFIKSGKEQGGKYRMQMHNADGSISEMCGNGLRCVAKYLYDRQLETDTVFTIETGAGPLTVTVIPEQGRSDKAALVRVNMGEPILERAKIPVAGGEPSSQVIEDTIEIDGAEYKFTAVSMGNPHCIIYVDDVHNFPVHTVGPKIENHPLFPRRVNVEFIQVVSPEKAIQRTWERGSGETLACGTGASAVCVAGMLTGRTKRKLEITLLGGVLDLQWDETDNCVYKTGPAETVFEGIWQPSTQ